MAERRMFTKKVTDDDHFMELSASAQALYLHLNMSADDDGFCNQISVAMFKAHASVQDLEALLEKRYIYQFENGVIVIKHWRMANALRKDRYTPTAFQEELAKLQLKDNGSYTWLPDGCQTVAACLPQDRLGKDRIGKDRIGNNTLSEPEHEYSESFEKFWEAYPKKVGKKEASRAFKKVKEPLDVLLDAIEEQKLSEQWSKENGRFIPNPATWLNQGRWEDHLERREVLPF